MNTARIDLCCLLRFCLLLQGAVLASIPSAEAQRLVGMNSQSVETRTPRESAPVDITGYWESVISEDYRYRMFIPGRRDYAGIALTEEGRARADRWDPERDASEDNACLAYGVGNIMRMPGRLHIRWDGDSTLVVETDHGRQERQLRFEPFLWNASSVRTLQGDSRAEWGRRSLSVETRNMSPSYIRRNGVPLSENAVVMEYFYHRIHPDGTPWFTVTTVIHDSRNLRRPYYTSSDFRKLDNGDDWNPQPCVSEWGPHKDRVLRPAVERVIDRLD